MTKDKPHFEKSGQYTWRDLLKLHQSGHVDEKGYVKI